MCFGVWWWMYSVFDNVVFYINNYNVFGFYLVVWYVIWFDCNYIFGVVDLWYVIKGINY